LASSAGDEDAAADDEDDSLTGTPTIANILIYY